LLEEDNMQCRTGRFAYAGLIIVLACMIILSSGAMGGYFRSMDAGQPRDLINRPACWTAEEPDDISRCELDD
jgi:hypothetical protein